MRTIDNRRLRIDSDEFLHKCYDQQSNILWNLKPKIIEKYFNNDKDALDESSCALHTQLFFLLYAANGNLEGKTVLDLGCGSLSNLDDQLGIFRNRMFEPWLCRILPELGAKPIGIDIGINPDAEFEFYQRNLNDAHVLDFIKDKSIDIVNCNQFYNSPFLRSHVRNAPETLKSILIPQIERVLKPEGAYIFSEDYF